MLQKTREFAARLHEDESGPNTIEWILLITVGLFILIGIYMFVNYAMGNLTEEAKSFSTQKEGTGQAGGPLAP